MTFKNVAHVRRIDKIYWKSAMSKAFLILKEGKIVIKLTSQQVAL